MEERTLGVTDTLQGPDMTENVEKIITLHQEQETNRYLWTKTMNSCHFYCGRSRPDNKDITTPVYYSTICKWKLRSQDRRVAQSGTKYPF